MCIAGFGRVCDSSSAATLLFKGDPVSGIFRANFEQVKVDVFFFFFFFGEVSLSQMDWGFISR